MKKREGPDSPSYADDLLDQAEDLLRRGRESRAEPILRESVAILQKKRPDSWLRFRAESLLGVTLFAQQKFAEAEPLILNGYAGLKEHQSEISPILARHRVREAGERLIRLYDAWGQKDKADQWRAKVKKPDDATIMPH